MADFKEMYFRLFNRVTDAVDTLQKAQQEGENEYIESKDADIHLLKKEQEDET